MLLANHGVFAQSRNPLLDGLIAWWPLNETSGNRLDSHTGGYTLTQSGTVGSTTGKVGNAATGWGDSNFLSSSNVVFNFGDTTFYFAVWVYIVDTATTQVIVSRDQSGGDPNSYSLFVGATETITFRVSALGDTNRVSVTTPSSLSVNTWHFIEAYHDAANNLIGIATNGGAFTTVAHSTGVFAGAGINFVVGDFDAAGANARPMASTGRIDELAIYNRIPNSSERSELYNAGTGRTYPG